MNKRSVRTNSQDDCPTTTPQCDQRESPRSAAGTIEVAYLILVKKSVTTSHTAEPRLVFPRAALCIRLHSNDSSSGRRLLAPPRISALAVVVEHRCRLRQPAPEVRGSFTADGAQRSSIPFEVHNLPGLGPPDHRVTVSGRISRNSAEIRSPDATPTIARPPFSKSNLPPTYGNVGLPHRRPADFWKRKLAAFLHDTPTKCLTIREHQEKSHIAMSRAGFTAEEIGCYDYEADWAAAAADRYPFPTRPRLRSLLRLRRPPQPVPPPIWRCEGNSRSSARLHPHRQ